MASTGHRLRVPGRLCLFGEHSDWAGQYRSHQPEIIPGYCIVCGTDQSIPAHALSHDRIRISSEMDGSSIEVAADVESLRAAARKSDLYSYVLGVATVICEEYDVGGLALEIGAGDLPVRKGLSSSAAVCVLMARAFNKVYGLGLSLDQEMDLAYRGERESGSECGRMDQVCALGSVPTHLTFDGDDFHVEELAVADELQLLVVDLGREKDTRRILEDLNGCYPLEPGKIADNVRNGLGPLNAELVERARAALEAGDAMAVGALMTESQRIFNDHVVPASAALEAPRLNQILDWVAATGLAWGGKGVGSQGDGCAQFVTRGAWEREELARRLEEEQGLMALNVTIRAQ